MVATDAIARKMKAVYARGPFSRFGSQYAFDALAWVVALAIAQLLRFDLDISQVALGPLVIAGLVTAGLQFIVGWGFFLYRGRHPYGSFGEVRALMWTLVIVTALVGLPVAIFGLEWSIPRGTVFLAMPIAFVMMGGARYTKRLVVERTIEYGDGVERALVYGAGYLGSVIVRRMRTDRHSPFIPVGLIDDDPAKRHVELDGVRVQGTLHDLGDVARRSGATVLIVTIARADADLLSRVSDTAAQAGLRVKVLPPFEDILEGKSRLADLRDISIEDIIGRHPVDTSVESIAGYLKGKRVLVTGAGGSIGAELCRQLGKFEPAELIMLDRDETALQGVQLSISGHGLLDSRDVVLADIRDLDALTAIFSERRPEVVFHAAALKHLPMLEQYPEEAWKTNVLGTLNVLRASLAVDVATFVNISTDKAANPTSVLGHSKRVAEKLTSWAAEHSGRPYLSVRFGNVLGSRGSMLPVFATMIEAGGPLTITHPEVTRFFMTIPEACQLVIQAGGIGQAGEVLILDMGEPVKILDIARRMIDMSGKDIAIVFTGLRPGEKLHEELVAEGEGDGRRIHPQISHARMVPLDPARLDRDRWMSRLESQLQARTSGVSA